MAAIVVRLHSALYNFIIGGFSVNLFNYSRTVYTTFKIRVVARYQVCDVRLTRYQNTKYTDVFV